MNNYVAHFSYKNGAIKRYSNSVVPCGGCCRIYTSCHEWDWVQDFYAKMQWQWPFSLEKYQGQTWWAHPPNVYMVGELNKADGKPLLQAIKLVPLSECGSPTLCGRGHTCTLPLFIIHVAPSPPLLPPFQNSCIRLLFWDGIDFLEAGYHGRTCPSP